MMKKTILLLILLVINNSNSFSKSKHQFLKIILKVFPSDYKIKVDDHIIEKPLKYKKNLKVIYLKKGFHKLCFISDGYYDKTNTIDLKKRTFIEEKLEKKSRILKHIKRIETGEQPKSIEFTPDGNYLLVALLQGRGVDVISVKTLKKVTTLSPPKKYAKITGFVETAFIKHLKEIWVSQLFNNRAHIFDLETFVYKETFKPGGNFPKVITVTADEKLAFISNWLSKDITVLDTEKRKLIKRIKVGGIPRGMVITDDNQYLYVCLFTGLGKIQKIDLKKMKIIKTLNMSKGRKRHLVLDNKRKRLYVSDLRRGSVFVISLDDEKVIKEIYVGPRLNTIKLTSDSRYLFVSSRGPDNKKSYLLKGPQFGKVFVIDPDKLEVIDWVWGMNQPTGLAISPDDRYMAMSNFLSHNIEVYRIK